MILRKIATAREKVSSRLTWIFFGLVIAVMFLLPLASDQYKTVLIQAITRYPYMAPIIIISFRIIGVVLAPLPGAPVALASIALLPWWLAMIYNFIGMTSGMICAFWIARKFREPIVARFAPLQYIHQWQEKISRKKQFFAFIALRLSALVALDFISYAAGLTKIPFRTFLLAILVVDIPVNLLFYYVGGKAILYSFAVIGVSGVVSLLFLFMIFYVKKFKKIA